MAQGRFKNGAGTASSAKDWYPEDLTGTRPSPLLFVGATCCIAQGAHVRVRDLMLLECRWLLLLWFSTTSGCIVAFAAETSESKTHLEAHANRPIMRKLGTIDLDLV